MERVRGPRKQRGCWLPQLWAGRRSLLGSKDGGKDIGSEGNIGKEGLSLKDKMLPTWALRGREQGRKTGCRVGAGVCVKEMGEGQDAGSTGAQGSPGSVTAGLSLAGHSMGHGRSQSGKQSSISLICVPMKWQEGLVTSKTQR